jgi:hypothetical protein
MKFTNIFARLLLAVACTVGGLAVATTASAFCGFYVSGADTSLFNEATMVVMMRDGRRTVLSMENHYDGPLEDFAMVVPVPQVLEEENVKTLPQDVFERVDQMGAPRLVEYWERDPCQQFPIFEGGGVGDAATTADALGDVQSDSGGVQVEAEFTVGEYEIVVLSTDESTALDDWLRDNNYTLPEGSEELLRPYVEDGMYFFAAKVNVDDVTFNERGDAMLSPLRFHYDSDDFSLPIRLGLINADEEQDLIVNILAPNQRYEVANYPNVTIPTNVRVNESVKDNFAEFYVSLMDETLKENPGAVITEYSWNAGTCDPCPGTTLTAEDFATLGADVAPGNDGGVDGFVRNSYVLTRLHARYDAGDVGDDLVFTEADPIVGGRGTPAENGELEQRVLAGGGNSFQGRYAITHEWEGDVDCEDPQFGIWGGQPPGGGSGSAVVSAQNTAFADRNAVDLESAVATKVEGLDVEGSPSDSNEDDGSEESPWAPELTTPTGGGGCSVVSSSGLAGMAFALVGVAYLIRRRQRFSESA